MIDLYLLKAIAKTLVLPPVGLLLVALVGVVMARRHPRSSRIVVGAALASLLALGTPFVAVRLLFLVDETPPLDLAKAERAQAIVILGGGVRRGAVEYGGDTLGRLTLERVRYGARVARQLPLPVLVSGGSVLGDSLAEATLMRRALEDEFGVKVRWVEDRSRNTRENARLSSEVLRAAGVQTIVLVLHSFDVPRAVSEFETAGLRVIPAPTGIPSRQFDAVGDFLPGIAGLVTSHYACYELAALSVGRVGAWWSEAVSGTTSKTSPAGIPR